MNNDDMTKVMFGEHAVHVPMWMWVQWQGEGTVIFAGASRVSDNHPLRYGDTSTHQFILGESIIRPHLVFGTDAYKGHGISGLLRAGIDVDTLVDNGKLILDPMGKLSIIERARNVQD